MSCNLRVPPTLLHKFATSLFHIECPASLQVDQATSRAEQSGGDREALLDQIHELSAQLDESRGTASHHETQHNQVLGKCVR